MKAEYKEMFKNTCWKESSEVNATIKTGDRRELGSSPRPMEWSAMELGYSLFSNCSYFARIHAF